MISELVNVVKQQNAKHRKTRVIEIRKNLNQAPEQLKVQSEEPTCFFSKRAHSRPVLPKYNL